MPTRQLALLALGFAASFVASSPEGLAQSDLGAPAELGLTELSLVLPILPRQVDAPADANFPRLLPHRLVVRTAEPTTVTILIGERVADPSAPNPAGQGLVLDPATARPLTIGSTVASEAPGGGFELRTTFRVPHGLPMDANLAIQAVSVSTVHPSAAPSISGAIDLHAVDAAWVDPSASGSAWTSSEPFGARVWTGPIGGLPRSSELDLRLSVGLEGSAPGHLGALPLAPGALSAGQLDPGALLAALRTGLLEGASAEVQEAESGSTAVFELRLSTDSRGLASVLLFELDGPVERRLRAVLAEPR